MMTCTPTRHTYKGMLKTFTWSTSRISILMFDYWNTDVGKVVDQEFFNTFSYILLYVDNLYSCYTHLLTYMSCACKNWKKRKGNLFILIFCNFYIQVKLNRTWFLLCCFFMQIILTLINYLQNIKQDIFT